jgi:hypothetical protein
LIYFVLSSIRIIEDIPILYQILKFGKK